MAASCLCAYYFAEIYGRSHYWDAISNARIVRGMGEFSLPHIFGEQAIYWGSEFVVLPSIAILLFVIGRDDVLWDEWNAFATTSIVGCIVYILFPVSPPWVGSGEVIALGDPFGAMPSLHMSDAVIVAVCVGRIAGRVGYVAGWAYVCMVAYSVISTRNHYPADIVAGILLALVAMRVNYSKVAFG